MNDSQRDSKHWYSVQYNDDADIEKDESVNILDKEYKKVDDDNQFDGKKKEIGGNDKLI
ncbi:hypothetical protein C1645_833747 [Glomus cerebriforme]|uniref:Uncharacterized protein n=1 Tax=Glomus cerebriforme TaxID=658196 RepID=A0A397SAZ8_9GLOM|nr:hypothetical protein C1645_833747 [Glomus cerebriforme]